MAYDLEEQEQIAALKAWWAKYGTLITGAITLALAAFAIWRGYDWWSHKNAVEASAMYEQLVKAAEAKEAPKVAELSGMLTKQHGQSLYASMGALLTARFLHDSGDLAGAAAQLQWAANESSSAEFKALARLRLAGVLLDQKQYDQALAQVKDVPIPAYEALYADRRGDIYLAQSKPDEARQAFKLALDKISSGSTSSGLRNIIQIKLDALGEG